MIAVQTFGATSIHISALQGMSRPPVVVDTLHYQTETDASGKLCAIQAIIEGVPKQLTLEPLARKRPSIRRMISHFATFRQLKNLGYKRLGLTTKLTFISIIFS